MSDNAVNAISRDTALRLCQEIREGHRGKWYRWTAWWCWGCSTFTKGDTSKFCWSNGPQNRGCAQVNARYGHQPGSTTPQA